MNRTMSPPRYIDPVWLTPEERAMDFWVFMLRHPECPFKTSVWSGLLAANIYAAFTLAVSVGWRVG